MLFNLPSEFQVSSPNNHSYSGEKVVIRTSSNGEKNKKERKKKETEAN